MDEKYGWLDLEGWVNLNNTEEEKKGREQAEGRVGQQTLNRKGERDKDDKLREVCLEGAKSKWTSSVGKDAKVSSGPPSLGYGGRLC